MRRPVRPLVLLDRDGVLNRFPGRGIYVTRLSQCRLIPGSAEAVAMLTKAGYEIHVISNQGCVSRGLLTRKGLLAITRALNALIRRKGGRIRRFHYCTHQSSDRCACKKPSTLLLETAAGDKKRLKRAFFIGDSEEDMSAGAAAGCTTVLVLSGRLKRRDAAGLPDPPDAVKKNLLDAVKWILQKKS